MKNEKRTKKEKLSVVDYIVIAYVVLLILLRATCIIYDDVFIPAMVGILVVLVIKLINISLFGGK